MSKDYTHWCKNGCGKSVIHFIIPKEPLPYYCERCNKRFIREELYPKMNYDE